ncbi:MAG: S8 family serine peptidase [Candidatus Thalassarchaeaceae archaeon]|jgi:serine protease AprX|nr:S8 family serine peptidase [Candidatus Thalassarchaeaceae archaeon]
MKPDNDIEEVAEAFVSNYDKGTEDTQFNDAFPWFVGIVSGLITFLSILILILWLWADMNGVIIGGPPPTLTGWEESYRDLTGLDEIEGLDGSGVVVCVVDSGIELNHPDLQQLELAGWFDVINSHQTPYDDEGHGTAMAGLIVAQDGLRGAAPGVDLLVVKAIDETGTGTDSGIAQAVDWCVENQADIISLSLGGDGGFSFAGITTDQLEQAVQDALDEGVFVIAAAGNDGGNDDGDVSSPGSVEDVICVGGVTRLGNVWSGSSQGDNNGQIWPPMLPRSDPDKKPEVIAPGAEVPVLMAGGSGDGSWWGWASGTSASTAWVSGGLALLLEAHPELQREGASGGETAIELVKQRLSENSQMDDGQNDHDDYFGYGIFKIDFLIDSFGNESSTPLTKEMDEEQIVMISSSDANQAERRKTAKVPPVSSTKAAE